MSRHTTQRINEQELAQGILDPAKSWHHDFSDQSYVYIGNLNRSLTEGDILTVFSQFGIPTDIYLVRDRDTGDSRGFAYLQYEDQRSTVLAVDNLNGAKVGGRALQVDHTWYEPRDAMVAYSTAVKQELARDTAG